MEGSQYDYIVIGGGVVGCMIARWLSRYEGKVLLVEKEADIGMGATCANSAIVHAGFDPLPGSLKAQMNVRGNAMFDELSADLGFGFDRRGEYVVAIGDDELPMLDTLLAQGKRNAVPDMRLISGEEMLRREPNINPQVSGALWAASGGLCDPFQICVAAAENAVMNGAKVMLNTAFEDFLWDDQRIVGVRTNQGEFRSRWVINAAGIYADAVMHKAGVRPDFFLTARKGEYFVFDRAEIKLFNVLFPVPTAKGKGILVTSTIHENTIVGPNANVVPDKEDTSSTKEGSEEIWTGAQKLIPSLSLRSVIANFVGLRPTGNGPSRDPVLGYHNDFIIEIPKEVQGFVNLGGIESPGLTSAPAIAEEVVRLLEDAGEPLKVKKNWNPIRPARPRFAHLSHEERKALTKKDPSYGRIVCRCENVTEGEILAEIHAPIPAHTYDAIKRRTWLGTGRCQGGFDMTRVVDILAREMEVSPLEVSKRGKGSEYLYRTTKATGGEHVA